MDARRRARIDEIISEFRADTDRETMVRLAAEVVRLNRTIGILKDGIDQAIDGKEFILMRHGPHAEKNRAAERRRDRSARWV